MPPLGKMAEFDPKTQKFESYLERFEHFLTANDIADAKRLPVFLTVIGPEAYEVLRSLVVPATPGEKSYAEVKRLLKEHYSPRSSVIAERCKFNRRVQQEGESVEVFIVELKHLVRKCDYGDFLQDALQDRLVAGIRNEETRRALFAERELTFDGACKIALDRELAARDTEQLRSGEREAPQDTSRDEGRPADVLMPPAPPAAAHVSICTEPGTSGTTRKALQQLFSPAGHLGNSPWKKRPAGESKSMRRGAEATNAEATNLHQLLLPQTRQLVEELRASRVVQQQLAAEMRSLGEATGIIATTLRQLLAALVHGLHEPPQP
ncbi:uncharacterized protein LOC142584546 [Dermacentor variabilis]|uniref:uncharacterized protein LOC142584546 n=1 Tax=Dermacentor variabilis TaxID=34621 RepID=UPI003F5C4D82